MFKELAKCYSKTNVYECAGHFDPYKFTASDMSKAHMITYETLLEDEECQVLGFVHIGDLKGVSAAHITLWTPIEFTTLVRWGEVRLKI